MPATSSGWPARPAGTSCLMRSAGNASPAIGEAMMPGATAFTVMPREASSCASDLVAPIRPALAAA